MFITGDNFKSHSILAAKRNYIYNSRRKYKKTPIIKNKRKLSSIPEEKFEHIKDLEPDENGKMKYSRFVHQLYTSVNFANKNWFVTWYGGGLNFQIEHHLFPNICHVHYRKISNIVRDTAIEYNLPYHSYKTFYEALANHTKMLYTLGRVEDAPGIH